MARPLRTAFPGAIYHVMSRGNARQVVFRDELDYQRMVDGLAQTVDRFGWELLSFVLIPNHFHLFLRTPRPNLSRGMQYLVSGYANWHAKRHRRPGHLFQGRFKNELIEDESYFWTVSRYVHLNPVRGKVPLAVHPRDWPWSSYRGYAQRRHRVEWVAYDLIYSAWRGEVGGGDPEAAYRRFVEAGLTEPPENPLRHAVHGWLVGTEAFVARIRSQVQPPRHQDEVPASRRLASLDSKTVIAAVAEYYGVDSDKFRMSRSRELSRDVAAWL
jgi:putative transposase